jgi:hypothetical protein
MRRFIILLLGVLALLCSTAASADSDKTFDMDGIGITFTYPSSFKPIKKLTFARTAGSSAVARGAVALDSVNLIIVSRYNLRIAITAQNVQRFKHEVDSVIGKLAGKTVSGRRVTYGGLPGYEYRISLTRPTRVVSRIAVLFAGATEYLINCQSTAARRAELEAGCRKALSTLRRK